MSRQHRAEPVIVQCKIRGNLCNVCSCHTEDGDVACRKGHVNGIWYNRVSGKKVPTPENVRR